MISFAVDTVPRAESAAPSFPLPEVFARLAGRPLVSCTDVDVRLLRQTGVHPLAAAVYRSFVEHRPLVLTPDAIWLTIAQGFAQHVITNSESLREKLVSHSGKLELVSPVTSLRTVDDWTRGISGLREAVRAKTKDGIADLMRCDFTTSTAVTQVASDIVLLETFKNYFDYDMVMICGIPEVTMLGTVEDWRKIETRVAALAAYDLAWWTDLLLPVCRELRRTVEGQPDLDFWQCICMPQELCGGRYINGWIVRFFPYLSKGGGRAPIHQGNFVQNGVLALRPPGFPLRSAGEPELRFEQRRKWLCLGVELGDLPLGLSQVPVEIRDEDGSPLAKVQLLAGFVGVTQNEKTLAVKPHIGWGVLE